MWFWMVDDHDTLRSVSDPQAQMQAIADRAVRNLRTELNTKINAMEQATSLWHDDLVRVPTDVQKTTDALRDFLEEFVGRTLSDLRGEIGREIETTRGDITQMRAVSDERQKFIEKQFLLLKESHETFVLTNGTAIERAFNAQKEVANETQRFSEKAIAKSETATAEAIKATNNTFDAAFRGLNDRYNDLKSRLDRGEGLGFGRDRAGEQSSSRLFSVAALVIAGGTLVLSLVIHLTGTPQIQTGSSATGQLQADNAAAMRDLMSQNAALIKQLSDAMKK